MKQRSLGGSASHIKVGEIGYGCMGLTWGDRNLPEEQCFAAMKKAIDLGSTFWNSGSFYGVGPKGEPLNLLLIARFFTKYPELADKVFLSVKSGLHMPTFTPDGSPEFLREDVDRILKALDGKKKLDMFECARVDPKTPIETTIEGLSQLVKEGKFDHIGLSEVSANTIRRAYKIHPVATVELEHSIWYSEARTNGVLSTCKELGIAVIAYSPLGRGILAGKWKTLDDVPEILKSRQPRYSPENFENNRKVVDLIEEVAKRRGATTAQVAIKWVLEEDEHVIPIPGATHVERVEENLGATNVELTKEDLQEIEEAREKVQVIGDRYGGHQEKLLWA